MSNSPIISIIVPIYNVEKYLPICIDSILLQSYKNLEIILVDDGATDSSGSICDNYACLDSRVKVIHKMNGGLSDARNAGLDQACGEYIAFVDSDDYIEPDMITQLYESCKNQGADVSVCGRKQIWDDGKYNKMFCVENVIVYTAVQAIEQILLNGTMDSAAWDKLYKRELFNDMRYPVGVLHEDVNFTSRLFYKSQKIVKIPYIGYNYRMRKGSITKQGFKAQKMDLFYQTKLLCDFIERNIPELSKQSNKFYCFNLTNLMTLLIQTPENKYIDEKLIIRNDAMRALKLNVFNTYMSIKDKIRMIIKIILLR